MQVLAGDIGGTKTRLAVVEVGPGTHRILATREFASREAPRLAPIVEAFMRAVRLPVERAGFGIAGPVVGEECRTPNLPWTVSARTLERELGLARVVLVNDFAALGHGIPLLGPEDTVALQEGVPDPAGVVALIGAGTGLGAAYLVGGAREVLASEGGHANFAPRNEAEWGLQHFLAGRYGHVSCERVLSGPGLVDIYRALAAGGGAENPDVAAELSHAAEPAAVVSAHGLRGSDLLCVQALDLFVSAYGAQAGNLALTVLATGGVYVAGGIAPRILAKLVDGTFIRAFGDKGRLSPLVARIPVHVIVGTRTALLGAALVAGRA